VEDREIDKVSVDREAKRPTGETFKAQETLSLTYTHKLQKSPDRN
jgi:hypothetical protein